MLEKLALKHSLWLKMAKSICKDAYLADDLVSEMYLKVSDYDKELNDYYIYFTIKHLYINHIREEEKFSSIEFFIDNSENEGWDDNRGTYWSKIRSGLANSVIDFEENDTIQLELPNCITWVEKQILLLRQNHSCRDISKQYQINKDKINRIERDAKLKIKIWLDQKK